MMFAKVFQANDQRRFLSQTNLFILLFSSVAAVSVYLLTDIIAIILFGITEPNLVFAIQGLIFIIIISSINSSILLNWVVPNNYDIEAIIIYAFTAACTFLLCWLNESLSLRDLLLISYFGEAVTLTITGNVFLQSKEIKYCLKQFVPVWV